MAHILPVSEAPEIGPLPLHVREEKSVLIYLFIFLLFRVEHEDRARRIAAALLEVDLLIDLETL